MSEEQQEAGGLPDFLRDPKGMLQRRWRWMVLALVVGLAATGSYVLTIPIRYLATASVLVTSQQIPESFVQTTVVESPFERINALIGELTAREELLALEERHDIYPELRDKVPIPELVAAVRSNIAVGTQRGLGPRSRGETSAIYTISFRHKDPRVAAAVANDLADHFTAASVRIRGRQARVTTEFMRTQLHEKERELRDQEAKITAFKERYRGELPSELGGNLAKLDRLSAQRETIQKTIADTETRLAMMATTGVAASPDSPSARLASLRSKLAQEMAVYTEEHPNVIAIRRQIATLESEIASGQATSEEADPTRHILMQSAERSLRDLRRRLTEIDEEITEREARVARTPKREEELNALEVQASVMRTEYLALLRKVETAELAEKLEGAQQGERVSILDRALPPSQSERTRIKYLAAGFVASLGMAALIGAALEVFDPVLVSAEQLEDQFGLPVLGSVPRIS